MDPNFLWRCLLFLHVVGVCRRIESVGSDLNIRISVNTTTHHNVQQFKLGLDHSNIPLLLTKTARSSDFSGTN